MRRGSGGVLGILMGCVMGFLAAWPAGAAEPGETLVPKLRVGDARNYIELYGQLNKALLVFDDGRSTLGYFPVDNDSSSSRIGLRWFIGLEDGWTTGGTVEVEWKPYSTNYVDQLNRDEFNWGAHQLRKAEIYFDNERLGRVWLGQGSMASDATAEADLSATTIVGYSLVADIAGGPLFRRLNGDLSSIRVADAFTNFDGLSRKLRARYDTPSFSGLTFSASIGQQVVPENTNLTVFDVAALYNQTFGDIKTSSAIALSKPGHDEGRIDGSTSLLHVPSGLSITLAAAFTDRDDRDGRYAYLKLGYQTRIFDAGTTAFSIDGYLGQDVAIRHSDSRSVGVQAVQYLDYLQTELYLGGRLYDYDDVNGRYYTSYAFISGARIRF